VAASLLFGTALGALTPPLHVPDEPSHFYRIYRISEGHLDLVPEPKVQDRPLPRSLEALTSTALADIRFQPEKRLPPGTLARLAGVRLEPRDRTQVHHPQTIQYTCVPYLVPAAAVAVGRLAGAEPLALLYLARAANLVFGSLAVVAAIRLAPAMRWWLALLALTPMAVQIRASASADVMGMSAAVVLIAAAWRLTSGDGGGRPLRPAYIMATATVAAALLCAARPPYVPLALLPVLAPAERLAAGRAWAWRLVHILVVAASTAWGFATAMRVGYTRPGSGIDPALQLRFALAHPVQALEAIGADYWAHTPRYLAQLVGKLGWLDTPLQVELQLGYLAVLLALLLVDGNPLVAVRPRDRAALFVALAGCLAGIAGSQYLVWTPVGAARIPDGIQGRYFLPVALAVAWLVHHAPRAILGWRRLLPRLMAVAISLVAVSTLIAVWRRYYG
jgi:uncharacterized membrane protein